MRFCKRAIHIILCIILLTVCCTPCLALAVPCEGVVILDAGHGGEDGGAVSADGTPESGINLQITLRLADLLTFMGYDVKLTREGEGAVYSPEAVTLREKKVSDLKNRVGLINGQDNAFVISIHQNSLPGHPRVHGAKVFYNSVLPAQQAGMIMQSAMNAAVNGEDRPVTPIDGSIYLMKESRHPAVLVECGFMSNPTESIKLQDSSYQMRLAVAIAAGYGQFCSNQRGFTNEG